jgi:hypothetical protein
MLLTEELSGTVHSDIFKKCFQVELEQILDGGGEGMVSTTTSVASMLRCGSPCRSAVLSCVWSVCYERPATLECV